MLIGARLISVVGHPSSVRAYGPATFPVGEGFLRRGLLDFGFAKSLFIPQYAATPPDCSGGVILSSYAKIGFSASASLSFWAWASARSLPRVVK